MACYADTPPGYDYVVPPRVFAPLPNSGPRPFLGDDRSLLAHGTSEWVSSRINLGQPALPTYQENNLGREPVKQQSWWKNFGQVFDLRPRKWQVREPNWKPVSLRAPFLLAVIVISITLVAVLQVLLLQSRRNRGIIFAADVNSLPLKTTFPYLYLPTIIAVAYGFLWNWIDLDVRRIEPFLQLAKDDGATGRESLLLHYPVDFLASVPIKAMKTGHWPVFIASIATVFVFWGITPTQSGIFATDTLNKSIDMVSMQSTSYISLSQQAETLSAKSAQSVASIMWLNETLPPFMTAEYVLAPFAPADVSGNYPKSGNWTASTSKYSVDVNCEVPISWTQFTFPMINSTWGCHFQAPLPQITANNDSTKVFSTLYAGYYNEDGLADYYLSGYCPPTEPNSFLVQWSKLLAPAAFEKAANFTAKEQLEHFNVTTLFCRSTYHVQQVEATVGLPNHEVLDHRPTGAKQALPTEVFNTSTFEASMNMGHERFRVRTDFPTTNWPSQTAFLANSRLDLRQLSTMAPYAIGASQLPLEDYLDPKKLADSYQSAYRLLFARQLVDVLSQEGDPNTKSRGRWSYRTQAVILVPAFTYIVETLLSVSILFAIVIMYYSTTRVSRLQTDPATLAAVMSLAADDPALLGKFKPMDQANEKELELCVRNRRFRLHASKNPGSAYCLQLLDLRGDDPLEAFNDELQATKRQETMRHLRESDETKAGLIAGLQPTEFKARMGLAFFVSQIALFAVIAGIFATIQQRNGLPIPSSHQFVRQLLENYLPTAIGTFIEPFWVVLNRHLCFLQPFDELRRGHKTGEESLNLEYSSLPPQLTIFKAWSNGNILLGIVCTMALLANGLSIALSGLFFEDIVAFETPAAFQLRYNPHFNPLDGAAPPFVTAYKQSLQSVYIATSNRTAHTPLSPWTDNHLFYFPFSLNESRIQNSTGDYRARTPAIGAQLHCQPLSSDSVLEVLGTRKGSTGSYNVAASTDLTVALTQDNGAKVHCYPGGNNVEITLGQPTGRSAFEFAFALQGVANSSVSEASFCREHIAVGWVRSSLSTGNLSQTIISSHEETVITCRPTLISGTADILVSSEGHLQKLYSENTSPISVQNMLSTTPADLIAQANQILLQNVDGIMWHNDSLPSDFLNYLIELDTNSSAHLDPAKSPPSMQSMIPPLSALYSELFGTLIASNMNLLLQPIGADMAALDGHIVRPTTRVFMSKVMFILAETILLAYIIVTVVLYLRRPWKILSRMPTSLASVMAFVAASNAIKDFRGTAGMSKSEMKEHLGKSRDRYGFGTFVGTDSKTHVGVEKHPFLAPLMRDGGPDKHELDDSKRSRRDKWRSKLSKWNSGKIREGGWI
ncbi:hypothetical protein BLS_007704 [Venturia inaequalis]|uniref:Uncharacterized protein n=1 Tax=Venturia inaequalis TaxID=5025 RepID=A0A8H3V0E9_VENIN|nr:hypothetical protein EG328_012077 [Venturia inaequalis]KAE9981194.1 hypothetical protein BLS_007704 [Venturia inaequalis]KAE9992452.1 hypothetical protein EG327_008968 [Venturia inaequalis]